MSINYVGKFNKVSLVRPVHRIVFSASDKPIFNLNRISGKELDTSTTPNNGDILKYDSTQDKFIYGDPSSLSSSLLPRFAFTETADIIEQYAPDWTPIGGPGVFEVSLTPQSVNSKLLFETIVHMSIDDNSPSESSNAVLYGIRLYRKIGTGGSFVHLAEASGAGNRPVFMVDQYGYTNESSKYELMNTKGLFLDSPNTTDPVTYKLYWNPAVYEWNTPGKRILNAPGESGSFPLQATKSYMKLTEVLPTQQ